MHKVWKVAHQPGGLASLTDIELDAYIRWLRDGADDHGSDKKARRAAQTGLHAAELEATRRSRDDASA